MKGYMKRLGENILLTLIMLAACVGVCAVLFGAILLIVTFQGIGVFIVALMFLMLISLWH